MNKQGEQDIKSAYELAMERLDAEWGAVKHLTDAQRRKLASMDEEMQARLAEVNIQYDESVQAAREQGNRDGVAQLEAEREQRLQQIREETETRKEAVRGESD